MSSPGEFLPDRATEKPTSRYAGGGVLNKRLDQLLIEAIDYLLAADRPLPQRYFDHPFIGGMERLPRLPSQAGFGVDL